MPVIRVSDEVMEMLKKFAIPLEDTVDSVLNRILNDYIKLKEKEGIEMDSKSTKGSEQSLLKKNFQRRIHKNSRLERWGPMIINSLEGFGGHAKTGVILGDIEKNHGGKFSDHDRECLEKDGGPRWKKEVNWARDQMVRDGLLKKDSPWGIWELTEEGRKFFSKNN